jgi:subtilisin family serine protease
MEAIKAPFAWDVETESSNVMVAIVDTGIDKNHPDLKGSIVAEYNAITGGDNADDDHGHGTHVASTACGLQNGFGVAGMSWKCNLIAAKFLNSRGSGTTSDAIKAISFLNNYAKQNNVRIIANHSWGCGGGAAMEKVLRDGIEAGVFHVGAAGNSNRNNDKFSCSPGSYSDDMVNVIAVAASDRNDNKASFSSYGKSSVQLAAPGVDILGARHGTSSHIAWRGTSMATPHVAGLASLLLHRNPQMAARELRSRIVNFTRKDSGWEDYVSSGGILDAHASLTEGLECNKRRLKRCRKQCIASYRCQFIRTRRCRKACKQRWCPSE